jgi:hypothetical protein
MSYVDDLKNKFDDFDVLQRALATVRLKGIVGSEEMGPRALGRRIALG